LSSQSWYLLKGDYHTRIIPAKFTIHWPSAFTDKD